MPTDTSVARPTKYEPVMIAVSRARVLAWTLQELGAPDTNDLTRALDGNSDGATLRPPETLEWLHAVVGEALRDSLDQIEAEYRRAPKPREPRGSLRLVRPKGGA